MKKLNSKGFTLVEVLVSVTIMGIILAIAIPQLSNLQTSNKESKYIKYGESVVTSAKLYTDSYSKDMFGNNSSGCYDIPYSSLEAKNLVKDIKVDGSTCAAFGSDSVTSLTYVRVYKSNDNYLYDLQIVCHNKDGNIVYESTLTDDICDGTTTDTEGPTITISENNNWTTGKDASGNPLKATVTIADPYGLKENVEVEYGWTKTPDNISTVDFKEKKFTNARGEERELSFDVEYPQNENGYWYLVVRPINEGLRDVNGNYYTDTYTKSNEFKLDNTDPLVDEVTNSFTTVTNGKVTISATALDSLSGIKKIYYTYNSDGTSNLKTNWKNSFEVGSSVVTVTRDWTNEINETVYIVAEDLVGNKSVAKSAGKIEIDKTAPETPTITMVKWSDNSTKPTSTSGLTSYTSNTWSNKNIYTTAKSSSTDVASYEYTTAGKAGSKTATGSSLSITAEGTSTIKYKACDKAGNCSSYSSEQTIKVDKTAPAVPSVSLYKWSSTTAPTSTSGLTSYTVDTWSNKKVYTTASGSDESGDTSGLKEYQYTTTGATTNNSNKAGKTRNIEADGTSTIKYRACDKAGNCSSYSTAQTIKVDTTPPTIKYSIGSGTYKKTQNVVITATDTNYNYMEIHAYKNNAFQESKSLGNITSKTHTVTLDSSGDWIIYVRAYDKANNKQTMTPENSSGWYYQKYTMKFSYAATLSKITTTCTGEETCWHKYNTYPDAANCYNGVYEHYYCGGKGEETCWSQGDPNDSSDGYCDGCVHYDENGTREVTYSCEQEVYTCPEGGTLNSSTKQCEY